MSMPHWLSLLVNIAPLILAQIPGVPASIAPYIGPAIATAEGIPGATGQQKLAAAVSISTAAFQAAQAAGAPIDSKLETIALSQGISAVVTAVNGITKK